MNFELSSDDMLRMTTGSPFCKANVVGFKVFFHGEKPKSRATKKKDFDRKGGGTKTLTDPTDVIQPYTNDLRTHCQNIIQTT